MKLSRVLRFNRREAILDGVEVVDEGRLVRESFGDMRLIEGEVCPVLLDHDEARPVGESQG